VTAKSSRSFVIENDHDLVPDAPGQRC
jgi:hypothetical protein